jgi:hypothetical protein
MNLQQKGIAAGHVSVAATGEAGRRYTQMLLEDYKGGSEVAGNKYCTARLEGTRLADETQVHIYEVLWADLAKPANGLLRFFLGLFQLLLHLASLSRTAIDTGAAEGTTFVWRRYQQCQRYAIRLLQIFAPLLQLLVLVACGSCLSTASSYTRDNPALPLALGGLSGVLVGLFFIQTVKNRIAIGPWLWSLLAVLPALVGIAIPFGFMAILDRHLTPADSANVSAALAFWLLPGVGLFSWILSYYEDIRKGVRVTGIVLFAAAFLYFVVVLKLTPNTVLFRHLVDPAQEEPLSRTYVPLAAFWTAKVLLGYLRFCWFLIIALAFAALILGCIAWRSERDPARRARARAAVRTSRFAFALPCISFSLITLAIWASLIHLSSDISKNALFPDAVINVPFPHPTIFKGSHPHLKWIHNAWHCFSQSTYAQGDSLTGNGSALPTSAAFIPAALAWSVGYQLPVSLALIAIAGFLLTWWALRSALTERFPYRNDAKDKQHAGKAPRDTDNATSLHLGTWLSRGLDSTSVITFLLWCSVFLPAAWILLFDLTLFHPAGLSWLKDGLDKLQTWTLGIVYSEVFAAAVILAGLARSGGVVLGIVLDVDTYLRDTPHEAPPRARIFERYMASLRYIDTFVDSADGRGYDEIVIVAHSLGALISGDLLHFLQSRYSLEEKISTPIKLLTMGNPARQLLNRFFPYLYDWVRAQPDNGAHPLPAPQLTAPAPIRGAQLPHPDELGLYRWISAYRSGDYVGRSLWLEEWTTPLPT